MPTRFFTEDAGIRRHQAARTLWFRRTYKLRYSVEIITQKKSDFRLKAVSRLKTWLTNGLSEIMNNDWINGTKWRWLRHDLDCNNNNHYCKKKWTSYTPNKRVTRQHGFNTPNTHLTCQTRLGMHVWMLVKMSAKMNVITSLPSPKSKISELLLVSSVSCLC